MSGNDNIIIKCPLEIKNIKELKGVYFNHLSQKYLASYVILHKTYYLGVFENPIDAAVAYDKDKFKTFKEKLKSFKDKKFNTPKVLSLNFGNPELKETQENIESTKSRLAAEILRNKELIKTAVQPKIVTANNDLKFNANHLTGVHFSKISNKWMACLRHNNVVKRLGIYSTQTQAASAYLQAVRALLNDNPSDSVLNKKLKKIEATHGKFLENNHESAFNESNTTSHLMAHTAEEAEAAQEDKESEHLRVPKSTFQDQEELITSNDQIPFSQEELDFLSGLNYDLDETVEHCLPIIFSKNSNNPVASNRQDSSISQEAKDFVAHEAEAFEHSRMPSPIFHDQEELAISNNEATYAPEELDFLRGIDVEVDEDVECSLPIIFNKNSNSSVVSHRQASRTGQENKDFVAHVAEALESSKVRSCRNS